MHVHPNARFVYQANRASGATGEILSACGENSIAAYAINH